MVHQNLQNMLAKTPGQPYDLGFVDYTFTAV